VSRGCTAHGASKSSSSTHQVAERYMVCVVAGCVSSPLFYGVIVIVPVIWGCLGPQYEVHSSW
jgi:hypothetical protein